MTEVTVPALGESITEGLISQWLVADGEAVSVDQPIYELDTDKISTEVQAPVAGFCGTKLLKATPLKSVPS